MEKLTDFVQHFSCNDIRPLSFSINCSKWGFSATAKFVFDDRKNLATSKSNDFVIFGVVLTRNCSILDLIGQFLTIISNMYF